MTALTGRRWKLVLASAPLWPIAWLLVLVALVRMKYGFWPSYSHPDPDILSSPLVVLDVLLLPFLLAAPAAILGSVAVTIHAFYKRRWDWCLPLTVCCFVLFVSWLWFDPGGFLSWWAD